MKGIITLFLSLITAGFLSAQELTLSSSIDTNRIMIGEPIKLSLKAEVPAQTQFLWPLLPDTLEGIELLQAGDLDTALEGDMWLISQSLSVTSFDSGYFAIPPLQIRAGDKIAQSNAHAIAVSFPELDPEQDYQDIRAPLPARFNWWVIILLAVIILALAAGIYFLLKYMRRRKAEDQLTAEERLSPYELATLQLSELKEAGLWQKGKLKQYYSELSDVLRIYLQREMGVNAMESTPEEVAQKVQALAVPDTLKTKVSELMHLSALVKYARQNPPSEWHERGWDIVKDFVEQTHRARVEAEKQEALSIASEK